MQHSEPEPVAIGCRCSADKILLGYLSNEVQTPVSVCTAHLSRQMAQSSNFFGILSCGLIYQFVLRTIFKFPSEDGFYDETKFLNSCIVLSCACSSQ